MDYAINIVWVEVSLKKSKKSGWKSNRAFGVNAFKKLDSIEIYEIIWINNSKAEWKSKKIIRITYYLK